MDEISAMDDPTPERASPAARQPDAPSGPQKPLSRAGIFWYSLASLGCGTFFSFNNYVLPLFLERYTQNKSLLGLMGSTHSVEGAVIQPIVGALSDRCRAKLGRRRPFMLIFMPLTALFMVLTPVASHLPAALLLPAIIAGIFLFTVMFNIAYDPYQALMPDITPERQRGRVTSFWAFLGVVGQAGILFLPLPLDLKFGIVAAILVVTCLLTCAFIREAPPETLPSTHRNHFQEAKEAVRGLRTLHQAAKAMAVTFLYGVGVGVVLPYLTLFVKDITHCTNHQAEMMPLVLMISTAVTVLPFGWLADRVSPRVILIAGLGLIGLAMLAGMWVMTLSQIAIILVVAGLGNAAQSVSVYPLLTQLIPEEEVGFYTGLQTMSLSIAQPVTVVITGQMMGHGGYRVIFMICALCMFLGAAVCSTIKRRQARLEVTVRNGEMGRAVA